MKITTSTVIRREAKLEKREFIVFRAAPRTTFIVTRAILESVIGTREQQNWAFTAYGYRKEIGGRGEDGTIADREMTWSSRSGPELPVELSDLLRQMRR